MSNRKTIFIKSYLNFKAESVPNFFVKLKLLLTIQLGTLEEAGKRMKLEKKRIKLISTAGWNRSPKGKKKENTKLLSCFGLLYCLIEKKTVEGFVV